VAFEVRAGGEAERGAMPELGVGAAVIEAAQDREVAELAARRR